MPEITENPTTDATTPVASDTTTEPTTTPTEAPVEATSNEPIETEETLVEPAQAPETPVEATVTENAPVEATPQETATPAVTEELPKNKYSEIRPGMTIRVHQKIKDINPKGEEKERIQVYEGIVIARRHGESDTATITVRKISHGVGVEKIFPLNLPTIDKIELVKQIKRITHARLDFLKKFTKRLKEKIIGKTLS